MMTTLLRMKSSESYKRSSALFYNYGFAYIVLYNFIDGNGLRRKDNVVVASKRQFNGRP